MKKIFYLASIAALALSSCAKDDTTEVALNTKSGGFTVSASAESDNVTRNYLDDGKVYWSATDVIAAYSDAVSGTTNQYHQNLPFSINPDDAGKRDAEFRNAQNGMQLLGGENLFFYYPYNSEAPAVNSAIFNKKGEFVPSAVDFLSIKAQQGYKDGSFVNNMAPSVGFIPVEDVEVDGDKAVADVSFQPVADYLVFQVMGPEPVKKLELRIRDMESRTYLPIAGEGSLVEYTMNNGTEDVTDDQVRYFWKSSATLAEGATSYSKDVTTITIEPGLMTDLDCHAVNEYVFVVPGGILGMGPEKVTAEITVYDQSGERTKYPASGANINGGYATVDAQNNPSGEVWRHYDAAKKTADSQLENRRFYFNELDEDGERVIAEFNPNNIFIIHDELDWLVYFNEYAQVDGKYADPETVEKLAYGMDAYVCPTVEVLDFSHANIAALATEYRGSKTSKEDAVEHYRGEDIHNYISNFQKYGLPSIGYWTDNNTVFEKGTFNARFIGNNVVVEGVNNTFPNNFERTIHGSAGVFSDLGSKANIQDITFDELPAATWVEEDEDGEEFDVYGCIVAGDATLGKLTNVHVKGGKAGAIICQGTAANYKGISFEDVDEISYIIGDMDLKGNLEITNWNTAITTESTKIFGELDADDEQTTEGHYVVSAPATANYANLAEEVFVDRTDDKAVSVLIGEKSFWTGDQIGTAALSTDKKKYEIEFAEQLAHGKIADKAHVLTRDMDLNHANNEISWPARVDYEFTSAYLDGQNHVVTGLVFEMVPYASKDEDGKEDLKNDHKELFNQLDAAAKKPDYNIETAKNSAAAPFQFSNIKNIKFDGVNIDIETSNLYTNLRPVPTYVGLSVKAANVESVEVANLDINAHEGPESHNKDAYYNNNDPYIGWIAAYADNIGIENSKVTNVSNNVRGLAGMVGYVNFTSSTEVNIINSTSTYASNGMTEGMEAITELTQYDESVYENNYGNPFGLLVNNDKENASRSIRVDGCGAPAFLYDAVYPIVLLTDGNVQINLENVEE